MHGRTGIRKIKSHEKSGTNENGQEITAADKKRRYTPDRNRIAYTCKNKLRSCQRISFGFRILQALTLNSIRYPLRIGIKNASRCHRTDHELQAHGRKH